MVFSSMIFLWLFLPIVLVLYFISNKKFKNIILLFFSLIFYAWGEPKYILLMLFSILINYLFGLLIDRFRKYDKYLLFLAVISNLSILAYFKYFDFFANTINSIFGNNVLPIKNIILPIGISFYTFQILSYVIDLYRKEIKVQKNILNLALYVSFFPQLIAGPIVNYKDIEDEITNRKTSIDLFASGVRRFVYGLGKKVIFANSLALVSDTLLSNSVDNLNTPLVWLAMIAYTLQIYFDFSGYSDMAIGLGRMFGFHFLENFNIPYISKSITEFWRRWHISLSTWFKQYVYIPLGGNRKGNIRTYINLLIVFFATGLWHGASFNFIAWGLYYGFFLILEKMFFSKMLEKIKFKFINSLYVMLVVIIGWVLFRTEGLHNSFEIIKLMFSFDFKETYILMPNLINLKMIFIFVLALLLSGPVQKIFMSFKDKFKIKLGKIYQSKIEVFIIIIIMILCIFELIASSYNPFIYFRF